MSVFTLRDSLNNATKKTEQKIRVALQEFHNETGMIPRSVEFDIIDVRELKSPMLTDIRINEVVLKSTT